MYMGELIWLGVRTIRKGCPIPEPKGGGQLAELGGEAAKRTDIMVP